MDITDFVTFVKFSLYFAGLLCALHYRRSCSGLGILFGYLILVTFLWGFEFVIPYESDPWGQFIAEGMPSELLRKGVFVGLISSAAMTIALAICVKFDAEGKIHGAQPRGE